MTNQAPTYAEVLAAAREAAKQVESWPEWKKALSEPERVPQRAEIVAKGPKASVSERG